MCLPWPGELPVLALNAAYVSNLDGMYMYHRMMGKVETRTLVTPNGIHSREPVENSA